MNIQPATNATEWDAFLKAQRFSPFLQSWTMGDVYKDIGQEPVRLELRDGAHIKGICLGVIVPARRGRHIAVQYGPVVENAADMPLFIEALAEIAKKHSCTFLRLSPFMEADIQIQTGSFKTVASPLHLLAEHIWYLPLKTTDRWMKTEPRNQSLQNRNEEEMLMELRKTTRNLVRRAEKDGVTIERSDDPVRDVEEFIKLHDETRKRHHFTPYSNAFFRAQVKRFGPTGEAIVYLAKHEGQIIATSIHMQFGGETSYHHGASIQSKVPASYLLQWRAVQDAMKRGDDVYSFWGIAPMASDAEGNQQIQNKKHPFAGVTLFKTGFGGKILNLQHCIDIPLSPSYRITRAFEYIRKWKRGF